MDASIITFITSLTAFTASTLGPFVTYHAARVSFNANVLSNNRQKWINTLRDLIAEFLSQLVGASLALENLPHDTWKDLSADPTIAGRAEHMILTTSKIRLMINPGDADHMALLGLMDKGMKLIRGHKQVQIIDDEVDKLIEDVTKTSQAILKREWQRVKRGQ